MKSVFVLAAAHCITALVPLGAQEVPAAPPPAASPAAPPQVPQGPVEVNGVAATVNGKVITKNQMSMLLAPIYAQLVAQFPRRGPQFEAKFKEAREKILQELIDRQIILTEFKKIGGSIRPFFVDEDIKRQIQELYNGDEVRFREELKRSRLTMEGFRKMTEEKMAVQAMRARQFADAPPPLPDEVRKEYAAQKLSLRDFSKDVITFQKIFIPASDPNNPVATPETQLAHAEEIAKQIQQGMDFGEMAKQHSKDAFADKGGLQENVPRTDLSPEFAAIIVDSGPGTLVGPLLDPQGFTIVKVIKIDYGPSPPLGDPHVHEMMEERVRKQKTSEQYDHWIEGRRKQAMIQIKI